MTEHRTVLSRKSADRRVGLWMHRLTSGCYWRGLLSGHVRCARSASVAVQQKRVTLDRAIEKTRRACYRVDHESEFCTQIERPR